MSGSRSRGQHHFWHCHSSQSGDSGRSYVSPASLCSRPSLGWARCTRPHGQPNGTSGLWPPRQPLVGACLVAGASEGPSATLSRPQRKGSVGCTSSAPCPETDHMVDPPVPVVTQSTMLASSPSLDEAITVLPPSPQEDFRAHQELLKRVASSLQLQAEEMEEPSDSLFNVLSSSALGRVALPLHEGVEKISNALWQTPASLAPIAKRVECKYFVPAKGHGYLYTHPAPNSLVVESVNHRERQGQPAPTPKNKDSWRLDSFGRKNEFALELPGTGGSPGLVWILSVGFPAQVRGLPPGVRQEGVQSAGGRGYSGCQGNPAGSFGCSVQRGACCHAGSPI
ncbi:uncharacterized protein LOC120375542 [Mauremys reevesii]|uniref:uncharacterized protein LOC120375542 n=1 Tax=Mauremys reevesii TaxID=260615 RepID=UPI00193FB623|nr:uncharacterized protein LOC120375542 [Mauremys reevesii]